MKSALINETINKGVLFLQFNHPNENNPVNKALERAIVASCEEAEINPDVTAVILTGGVNRSFSVGGDFTEVKDLTGGEDVEQWIDGTLEMYIASLKITKPTIAAIDGYAIGIGFQLALTCDWRIGTDRSQLIMPELRHGIACTVGSYMLEKSLGRLRMTQIIFNCDPISAEEAYVYGLLNEISSPECLLEAACATARKLAAYPMIPYRKTKHFTNESFIRGLNEIARKSKEVHKLSFQNRTAQPHFKKILGKKYEVAAVQ